MKFNKLVFPHPVLGIGLADDFSGSAETLDLAIEVSDQKYTISFSIFHDNITIANFVENGSAIYCCESRCSGSLYRNVFKSTFKDFRFDIEKSLLRGDVDFQVYCVTEKQIQNYTNPAAHQDYSDYVFSLNKGDVIAYFGSFEFYADIDYQKLKAASSFMEIVPNDSDEKYTIYDIDNSKIRIKLPKDLYDNFKTDSVSKRKDYSAIIHASLVQNALTVALYNYKTKISDGILWARSIKQRLESEPELNNGSDDFDNEFVPVLVQKLLGNPNNRLVDCLINMSNINENQTI